MGGNVAPPSEEEVPSKKRSTPHNTRLSARPYPALPRTSLPRKPALPSLPHTTKNVKPEPTPPQQPIKPNPNTKPDSSLRPKVPASDRIHSWEMPFSIQFKKELQDSLPADLISTLQSSIFRALAPNTRNSYGAGILRFIEFCDKYNIPEASRMPASNILLAAFVSDHSGTCSGSCIKNWMSGIKAWHDFNGAPWSGDSRFVHLARSTASKEGSSFPRPQRNPITLDHLRSLHSHLNLSDPSHAALWAIATCAFWGCRRLGELTIPSRSSFDPKFHASRLAPYKTNFVSNILTSITFNIPWTKSAKEKGGRVVLTARTDNLCPVAAFLNHLRVRLPFPTINTLYLPSPDKS